MIKPSSLRPPAIGINTGSSPPPIPVLLVDGFDLDKDKINKSGTLSVPSCYLAQGRTPGYTF